MSRRRSSDSGKRPDVWAHIGMLEERQRRLQEAAAASSGQNSESKSSPADDENAADVDAEQADAAAAAAAAAAADDATRLLEPIRDAADPRHLLFVGPTGSGKSTIVQSFLNPGKEADKPKPTVALDFTFGRRTSAAGDRKDLCHIWELGGGERLEELVGVVLTPERQGRAAVVVVVDLSRPLQAVRETDKWARRVRRAVPDVPLLVLGAKWDALGAEDSVKRKAVCGALRALAIAHNAGLLFTSRKDKTAQGYLRAFLNHLGFGTEEKRSLHTDPAKPLVVARGKDKLDAVPMPPGTLPEAGPAQVAQAYEAVLEEYFADEESKSAEGAQLDLLPEPAVDAKAAAKARELEQYRAQVARKLRLAES